MVNVAMNSATIQKFREVIKRCAWLFESVKPLHIILLDDKENILLQQSYGTEWLFIGQGEKSYQQIHSMVTDLADFCIKEKSFGDLKMSLIISKAIIGRIDDILDYFQTTYQLLEEINQLTDDDWKNILDLKNVLQHLLHESDYTRKLDHITKGFVDYLSQSIGESAAIYTIDKSSDSFYFTVSSNNSKRSDKWAKLSFTKKEAHELLKGKQMAQLESLPFITLKDGDQIYLWSLNHGKSVYGLLFLTCSTLQCKKMESWFLKQLTVIINECAKLLYEVHNYMHAVKMGWRYQKLYDVTKKFHSTMDDRDVLEEVMRSITAHYPHYDIRLLFTHDDHHNKENNHSAAIQAFLTGTVQLNRTNQQSNLYVPLTGRQGVYGVIEIAAPDENIFPNEEIEFINLLGNTAGIAFENARLFQQSQKSISDLRLINHTTQHLNSNLRFNETVEYLLQQIYHSFDADEAGYLSIDQQLNSTVYPGSTPFFQSEEGKDLTRRIITQVNETGEAMFRGDLKTEGWEIGAHHSLVAIPMLQEKSLVGLVVALHKNSYHFSFDDFRLLQSITHHSTLALMNARLREELEHRVITDQLTGLYARDYLNNTVEQSLGNDQSGVMILVDIDNFKSINDTYGHATGDKILIDVAELVKKNIRKHDVAARWGGEELAIYLPICDINVGARIAKRLVEHVQETTNPRVTISCGLAYWKASEFDGDGDDLFIQADQALYRAKEDGKNRVHVYEI